MPNTTPYGLREIKIVRGAAVILLPVAQTADVTFQYSSAELKGDDILVEMLSIFESAKISIKNGGLPLEAIAMLSGATFNAAATYEKLTLNGGEVAQKCALYARAYGPNGDDVHFKFYNVILTDEKMNVANSQFGGSDTSLTAIKDPVGGRLLDIVRNVTATTTPVVINPYNPV